jgi:hypothetical protein
MEGGSRAEREQGNDKAETLALGAEPERTHF